MVLRIRGLEAQRIIRFGTIKYIKIFYFETITRDTGATQAIRETRAIRAIRAIRATRENRAIRENRATRAIRDTFKPLSL